jgi:hypothetical protein
MKATPFLLLALRVSFASACQHYKFCHCLDSNGNPDNNATTTICEGERHGASLQLDQYEYGDGTNNKECFNGCFDNCSWRRDCQSVGATGSDSSCRGKCIF